MTSQGKCETCGTMTPMHYQETPRGWFCSENCRAVIHPPVPTETVGVEDAQKIERERAAAEAEKARIEEAFDALLASGEIIRSPADPDTYLVIRSTSSKADAVECAERLKRVQNFDECMRRAFLNGMIDATRTLRRELVKFGPLKMEKPIGLCDRMIDYLLKNG